MTGRAGALNPAAGETRQQLIRGGLNLSKVSALDWLLAGGSLALSGAGSAALEGGGAAAAGDAAATDAAGGSSAADAAAGAGAASSGLLSRLAKDATLGAVLADLLPNAKYAAIWLGLMILALLLILMGLSKNGAKIPTPPIVVTP